MTPSSFASLSSFKGTGSGKSRHFHSAHEREEGSETHLRERNENARSSHLEASFTFGRTHDSHKRPGANQASENLRKTVQQGLREQHLNTLTVILHRCLLQGDYTRASRAWGMLLRTEIKGRFLDFRKGGRWGFGAEILGFRWSVVQVRPPWTRPPWTINTVQTPSVRELEVAKDYYKRLIIQYPYQKAATHRSSPLDFYPALYDCWIYLIQQHHLSDLKGCNACRPLKEGTSVGIRQISIFDTTLTQASILANDLDELLTSPPYSDSARLHKLREMVARWLHDLRENASCVNDLSPVTESPESRSENEDGLSDLTAESGRSTQD